MRKSRLKTMRATASPSSSRRKFIQQVGAGLWFAGGSLPAMNAAEDNKISAESSSVAKVSDSDVGSLFPFIESQTVKGEFPLSYLNTHFDDRAAWQRQARGRLLDLLQYQPPKPDLNPQLLERIDHGAYFQEKVLFNTTPDLRIPAYVLIPKNARLPAPGVVALHDHGGFYLWGKEKLVENEQEHASLREFKAGAYAGRSIASELARQGYVVLVIDMFYWGERRLLLEDDPTEWKRRDPNLSSDQVAAYNRRSSQNEQLIGRTIFAAGFTWPGIMFWDDIRSLDYLVSRPEVDKQRLGCVGLSVGGLRSCHLAALDDRIKAAVVVGWMCSFPKQLRHHIRHTIGHTKLVPGLYKHLDYPDVASLAMPAAMLVINGAKDTLFEPSGVQDSFSKLKRCYEKAGISDRIQTRLYDTPHEFNLSMQSEAWTWLKRWM